MQNRAERRDDAAFVRARLEILDVITNYFVTVDHRDFERLRSCFTDDASGDFDGRAVGPGIDAIIAFIAGTGPVDYPVDIVNLQLSQHHVSNHLVEIDGDQAWSETYATAYLVDRPASGPRLRTRGLRYQDELVRGGAGWRIQRRVHVCDWMRLDALEWAANGVTPLPPRLR